MLEWLENTQFPLRSEPSCGVGRWCSTAHALGTALVMGFVLIISLRLLGLFNLMPYASLRRMFPDRLGSTRAAMISGFILWMTSRLSTLPTSRSC